MCVVFSAVNVANKNLRITWWLLVPSNKHIKQKKKKNFFWHATFPLRPGSLCNRQNSPPCCISQYQNVLWTSIMHHYLIICRYIFLRIELKSCTKFFCDCYAESVRGRQFLMRSIANNCLRVLNFAILAKTAEISNPQKLVT